jgi:nucleoside-diphosphate-sugar epimerase
MGSEKPNILLTGSMGLIGKALKDHFRDIGYNANIIGVDLLGDNVVDIRDLEGMNKLFEEHKFDSIIHLAALKDINESFVKPDAYYDTNVLGTDTIVHLAEIHKVPQLIFGSSGSVDFSNNVYTDTKVLGESIVSNRAYGSGINLRLESVLQTYGDTYIANSTSLIDNLLRTLHGDKERFELYGNTMRSFVTLGAVCDKIVSLLQNPVSSSVVTFSEERINISTLEVVTAFRKIVGDIPYTVLPQRTWESSLMVESQNIKLMYAALSEIRDMHYKPITPL